ncbi:MAG: hypothetical protein HY066_08330 [Betaproteobacteria bacterium]|nr:hypothetical protein [Betaproteobacteria bacterium]
MNSPTNTVDDGRMSFDQAVAHVLRTQQAAFTVTPIFGDRIDEEVRAEGARVLVLLPSEPAGSYRLQFIAGPFFSSAYAAHESIAPADIPESIHELRFMPTRCEIEWFTEQVQVMINKLMNAAGAVTPEMPNYLDQQAKGAGPEAVFPVAFIGRDPQRPH